MKNDKRLYHRIPVFIAIELRDHHGIPCLGTIVDMTPEGVGVRLSFPPRSTGLIYEGSFNVPGRSIHCRLQVKNVYKEKIFGAAFVKLPEIDRIYLQSYLFHRIAAMGEYPPPKTGR